MINRSRFHVFKRKRLHDFGKIICGVLVIVHLGLLSSTIAMGNHLDSHSIFRVHKTQEGPDISLDPTLRRFLSIPEPQVPPPSMEISDPNQHQEKSIPQEIDSDEDPNLPPVEQGWKYLLTGRPTAALDAYRQALQNQPDSDLAHLGLGMAFKSLGNAEEAKQAITQALELNPRLASALVHLGYLYADGQIGSPDRETARRLFLQASQMGDPFARIALQDLKSRSS